MTPVALLVCMTIVTNVEHTTVASRACHYEQPSVAMAAQPATTTISENVVRMPDANVRALSVAKAPVEVKAKKPKYRKHATRKARIHHRASKVNVQPVMSEADNTEHRKSWFERLLDM
jgi:hypothetical protein